MTNKRKLRLFCDYCADTPLWESWEGCTNYCWAEGEYNKSEETLLSFGVSERTLGLMKTLQFVYEWPPSDCVPPEYTKAYEGLIPVIKEHLEREIGSNFEIEYCDLRRWYD